MGYTQPFREATTRAWPQTVTAVYGLDEMLEFVAHEFCEAIEILDDLIARHRENGTATLDDAGADYAFHVLNKVSGKCRDIDLCNVANFIDKTNHRINKGVSCLVVMERARAVRDLIFSGALLNFEWVNFARRGGRFARRPGIEAAARAAPLTLVDNCRCELCPSKG